MKYVVTINGKQYEVEVDQGTAVINPQVVIASNAPIPVAVSAEPQTSSPQPVPVGDGTRVEAPMPGAILAVKVVVGQRVKRGDVLVVLEAMKMENDVVAPVDGTVGYTIAKGAQAQVGDLLALLK